MKRLCNSLAALAVASAIWGISVTAVLAAKFTYPCFSTGRYNSHDLSPAQMQANYDVIIDYSLFPWIRELTLPGLPMSAAGAQHFAEAKRIFQLFAQGGLFGLAAAIALGLWIWRAHRASGFLRAGGVIALATPALLAIPLAIDFDRAFVLFHKIAFDNDLWIFDPRADPVINYLPEGLFMRNAFAIMALMVLLAVGCIVWDRLLRRRQAKRT